VLLALLPPPRSIALQAAWFVATSASAAFNFVGMKLFVFGRRPAVAA